MAPLKLISFALLGTTLGMPTTPNKRQKAPIEAYKDLTCTDDITNLGKNRKDRWNAAMSSAAMLDFDMYWNNDPKAKGDNGDLQYINSFMNWLDRGFNGQECGLTIDSCDFSSLQCDELNCPAHWQILLSLSNFHSFYLNLYTALGEARDSLAATMGSFVATFALEKQEPTLLDNLLKGFQSMAFDLLIETTMGPLGEALKDSLGDATDGIIEAGKGALTAVKDHALEAGEMPEDMTPEQKKNTLVETLQGFVGNWYNGLYSYMDGVLSGKSVQVFGAPLSNMAYTFMDGRWLFINKLDRNLFSMSAALQKSFSAMLVPTAWKLADQKTWGKPVILMKNENCFMGKPTDCMKDDAQQFGGSCMVEGKTMYLVGYTGASSHDIFGAPIPGCPIDTFVKLPGIEQLQEKTGVNKDNIIWSVWNAYVANGYKNGYNLDFQNAGASAGIVTPGLYQIPICDFDEAMQNYRNMPGGPLCDYGGW